MKRHLFTKKNPSLNNPLLSSSKYAKSECITANVNCTPVSTMASANVNMLSIFFGFFSIFCCLFVCMFFLNGE